MRRRDLPGGILASAAGALLGARQAEAQDTQSGARTNAEIQAGVTPLNTRYAPGDVRRYGAKGDGVTNDAPAFQAAIDVARLPNHAGIYAPAGATGAAVLVAAPEVFYLLTSPLNCTFDGRQNQHGIALRGDSELSPSSPAIIARHTGHVFDLTGSDSVVFDNLNIGTDANINPETCFFLARNRSHGSAGFHRFRNVRVNGKFKTAVLYNYGSESNVFSECVWYNEIMTPRSKVAVFSSHNIFGLTSTFIATATGPQSCVDHQILGGNFVNASPDAEADVIYLDAVNSLKIFGPWLSAGINSHGRALIFVDSTNGASSVGEVYGLQGEVGATQQFGIYFADQSVNTPTGWTIHGCYLPNAKYAVFAAPNTTLDNLHVAGVRELIPHGIAVRGVLQNSSISCGSMPLAIGTSRCNALFGDSSRWAIGSREHDYWVDSGAGSKAWHPRTEALTVDGKITVSEASCIFHGPLVTVSTTLSATTSLQCAGGVALGGLPAAAVAKSALVQVADANTGASIGAGIVSDSSILLPPIPARKSVIISASYFAA